MEAYPALRLREDDLAPALLFVALAAFACMTPAQNDTWWHLRSGQAMWQSRAFVTTEPFSFTAFGSPLQNHWWVSQLLFFAVFSAGGPVLLTLFAGASPLIAVYGSWRLLRGPLEVRVVLLAFLAVATAPEWSVRPQVISLVLLVLCAHLIVRDRLVWLPAVCVLWGNVHAMVVRRTHGRCVRPGGTGLEPSASGPRRGGDARVRACADALADRLGVLAARACHRRCLEVVAASGVHAAARCRVAAVLVRGGVARGADGT